MFCNIKKIQTSNPFLFFSKNRAIANTSLSKGTFEIVYSENRPFTSPSRPLHSTPSSTTTTTTSSSTSTQSSSTRSTTSSTQSTQSSSIHTTSSTNRHSSITYSTQASITTSTSIYSSTAELAPRSSLKSMTTKPTFALFIQKKRDALLLHNDSPNCTNTQLHKGKNPRQSFKNLAEFSSGNSNITIASVNNRLEKSFLGISFLKKHFLFNHHLHFNVFSVSFLVIRNITASRQMQRTKGAQIIIER